jgi:hypothetical protein
VLRKHLQARHNNEGLDTIPAAYFSAKGSNVTIPINEGQNPHVQLVQAHPNIIPQAPTTVVQENGVGNLENGAGNVDTPASSTEAAVDTASSSSSMYTQPSAVPLPTLDGSTIGQSSDLQSSSTSTQSYSLNPPQFGLLHNVDKSVNESTNQGSDENRDDVMKEDSDNATTTLPPLPITQLQSS